MTDDPEFILYNVKEGYAQEWKEECTKIHKNKYNYDNIDLSSRTKNGKIKIICPDHGEFLQTPTRHKSGTKCVNCSNLEKSSKQKMTREQFIKKSKEHKNHQNKNYDYSLVTDLPDGSATILNIICPEHAVFQQTAVSHATQGYGCQECANANKKFSGNKNTDQFIIDVKEMYKDLYDYSNVEYVNNKTEVQVYCNVHHDYFDVEPRNHLRGSRCPQCMSGQESKRKMTTNEFKDRVEKLDKDNIYDLSNTKCDGRFKELTIKCNKHGNFTTTPSIVLANENANILRGCPLCGDHTSHLLQKKSDEKFMEEMKLAYKDRDYDYSKVNYVNCKTPVEIICKSHSSFMKKPEDIYLKRGCPKV